MTTCVGIDLGTTNTVAAFQASVFDTDRSSGPLLPSVVAFPPTGIRLIGTEARQRRPIDPKNTIFSAKRIIGRRWFSADTQEFCKRYDFDIVEGPDGEPCFKTRAGPFNPTDIATLILGRVESFAQRDLSGMRVVITVPSKFGQAERQATREAAEQAGMEDALILDEPMAVALAYMSKREQKTERAAVFDFGGGTFDLAIVDCEQAEPRILSYGGDLYLGGDDIDKQMADWAAAEVLTAHRWDLRSDPAVFSRLVAECEQAKIRLSGQEQTRIDLTRVDPASPIAALDLTVDQDFLSRLAGDLVRRTFVICDEVLAAAGLKARDLDALFVAGGCTQLPMLREGIEAYFGRPVEYAFHPMHTVAIGASLAAGCAE
ncbi:MAG: Hsp70 family protein [Deltaproteobacteria bacterium]|nr:Hsp70 family protein [Deltaproteobacteria bacterium]